MHTNAHHVVECESYSFQIYILVGGSAAQTCIRVGERRIGEEKDREVLL